MNAIKSFVEKYGLHKYETFRGHDIKKFVEGIVPLPDILLLKLIKFGFQYGEKEAIKELLLKVSNISKTDKNGNNVLHYATENPNNTDIIKFVINDLTNDEQKKELLSAKNDVGLTPLMIAIENNQKENAQMLTIICKELKLPIDIFNIISLMKNENIQMFDFLLDKCDWKFNVFNKDGKAPLHVAIEENNIGLVRKLLENEANIEINEEIKVMNENNEEVIKPGNTPLLTAVKLDNLQILEILLEHTAEIDPKKVLLFMAKHNASKVFEYFRSHNFSNMREYVTQCIDDDECDRALYKAEEHKTANTPLHHIAANGNLQMFTVLISFFHNVNVCNHQLLTPLHLAAKNGNEEIFKRIFDISKISLYLKDDNEKTPLSLACKHNSAKIIDIILNSVDFKADKEKIEYFLKVAVETRCAILVKKLYTEPFYDYADPIFQAYFKIFIKNKFTKGVNAVITNCPDWETLLQRQLPSERNKGSQSPIQLLIEHMPEIAEIAFDKCVTDKEDGKVKYDFKIINDFYYADGKNRYYSEGSQSNVISSTAPVSDNPTTTPASENPATAPVSENPTTTPASENPATAPVSENPTTAPASENPTTAPASENPITAPAPENPATVPAPENPTTAPASENPTTAPASENPITAPAPENPATALTSENPTPAPENPATVPAPENPTTALTSENPTPAPENPTTVPAPDNSNYTAKSNKGYAEIVENHPLSLMVKHRRNDLIFHPLTEAYINAKWNTYAKLPYYTSYAGYALMCFCLTWTLFGMESKSSNNIKTNTTTSDNFTLFSNITAADNATVLSLSNITTNENGFAFMDTAFSKYCDKNSIVEGYITIIGVLYLISTFYIPCIRCSCLFRQRRYTEFFKKIFFMLLKNMFHNILGICCIVCDFPICIFLSDIVYFWAIVTAAFLSWMSFFFYLDKNPRIGVFVIMAKNVLLLMVSIALPALLLVGAFVQIFYIFFEKNRSIYSFFNSFVLTIVMMTGEVNYKETIAGRALVLFVIFFIFLVLGMMITMNLLTALAIADVSKTLERAVLMRRIKQIETIHNIEILMSEKRKKELWDEYCKEIKTPEDFHCCTNADTREFFNSFGLSKKTIRENYYDDVDVRRQRKLERDRNVAIEMEPLLP